MYIHIHISLSLYIYIYTCPSSKLQGLGPGFQTGLWKTDPSESAATMYVYIYIYICTTNSIYVPYIYIYIYIYIHVYYYRICESTTNWGDLRGLVTSMAATMTARSALKPMEQQPLVATDTKRRCHKEMKALAPSQSQPSQQQHARGRFIVTIITIAIVAIIHFFSRDTIITTIPAGCAKRNTAETATWPRNPTTTTTNNNNSNNYR